MAYFPPNDTLITGQSTQTASGQNIILATAGTGSQDVSGFKTIAVQIIPTGTVSSGVVTFEGSNDNTTFVAIPLYDEASLTTNPISTVSPATGVNRYFIGPVYWKYFRARISTVIGGGGSLQAITNLSQNSYTPDQFAVTQATGANLNVAIASGTVTTVSTVSTITNTGQLTPGVAAANLGKAEDAVAASGDTGVFALGVRRDAPVTSASASGDYQELAVNKWGGLLTDRFATTAKTYSSAGSWVLAATATDVAILPGNATTTVYVTKVIVAGKQTTAGSIYVSLLKRNTAASGGTSTGLGTPVPHDSTDGAAQSTILVYTANPTTGSLVGNIRTEYVAMGSTTGIAEEVVWDFGINGKPLRISGVAESIVLNLNSGNTGGETLTLSVEWYEI